MRVWFMIGTLIVGIIGFWGEQGRTGRTVRTVQDGAGTVSAQDGPNPVPTPKVP